MALFGIGIDILHVPRIAALASRRNPTRLASRILSVPEHSIFASLPSTEHTRFLAVRWAVKEAAYKALDPEIVPTWKELAYLPDEKSKPRLTYTPLPGTPPSSSALDVPPNLHVSVSHDADFVCAVVVAERMNPPRAEQ